MVILVAIKKIYRGMFCIRYFFWMLGVYGNVLDAHGERNLFDSTDDDDSPAEDEKSRLLKKKKEVSN